ncbi:MAG TPA: hypothetical protein VKE69_00040, partial [Planctomycetota bacterium]|nr:hypothetical protein [Planctomycetota bacterium]
YALLRHRGLARYGRGCVTHWLRGLAFDEIVSLGRVKPRFLRRVFDELELPQLGLDDLVVSVADFSVAHTTIVTLEERERDLAVRYGESRWLRRNAEVAREHRDRIERACGKRLADLVPEIAASAAHAR